MKHSQEEDRKRIEKNIKSVEARDPFKKPQPQPSKPKKA